MKRLLSLAAAVVFCLMSVIPAFSANSETVNGINATVSKKGGAILYDIESDEDTWELLYIPSGTVIPEKTKLFLDYSNEYYAEGQNEDPDAVKYWRVEYKGKEGCVRVSDLKLDLKAVKAPKGSSAVTEDVVIIGDGEPGIYEGPSYVYKKIGSVEPGTELRITTCEEYYAAYTEVDGVKGWLVNYTDYIAYKAGSHRGTNIQGSLVTLAKTNMYASIDNMWDEDPVAVIPAGKELKFDIYYQFMDVIYAQVKYKGKVGWVLIEDYSMSSKNVMYEVDSYLMTVSKMDLYEDEFPEPGAKTGKKTDAYKILSYDWTFIEPERESNGEDEWEIPYTKWYRVSVDDEYYWIAFDSEKDPTPVSVVYSSGEVRRYDFSKPVTVYSKPEKNAKSAGKLSSDEDAVFLFYYYTDDGTWECLSVNDKTVWLNQNEEDEYAGFTVVGRTDLDKVEGFPVKETAPGEETDEYEDDTVYDDYGEDEYGEYTGDEYEDYTYGEYEDLTDEYGNYIGTETDYTEETTEKESEPPEKTGFIPTAAGVAVVGIITALGVARARKKKED